MLHLQMGPLIFCVVYFEMNYLYSLMYSLELCGCVLVERSSVNILVLMKYPRMIYKGSDADDNLLGKLKHKRGIHMAIVA